MAEDSGERPAVAARPRPMALATGTLRNCQAETPAARATISSDDRVRRQNAMIPPTSTANGSICSM